MLVGRLLLVLGVQLCERWCLRAFYGVFAGQGTT
jgi:hypothetical protein